MFPWITKKKPDYPYIVGIDLGTTNTCVSRFKNGNIEIFDNTEGDLMTLSCLFFTENNHVIVGKNAVNMGAQKPENFIYDIKRMIGRSYYDTNLQENMKYLSFHVENNSGEPQVLIENKELGTLKLNAVELSSKILEALKSRIDEKLHGASYEIVLAVPAYFNMNQRRATLESAKLAGFSVAKLLSEPSAAALNFSHQNESTGDDYSLVYDLGGGTFDVTVVKRSQKTIKTLAVDGDSHLGGQDFDKLIMNHLLDELLNKYHSDPKGDKRILRRLRNKCKEAKEALSFATKTFIVLEAWFGRSDTITIELDRNRFECLADNLFQKTIDIMDRCLKKTKLSKQDITNVILSGGSTRIPKIQKKIVDYFETNRQVLNKQENPDHCVAKGAAIQAAILSKHPDQEIALVVTSEAIPLSLGFGGLFDKMNIVIQKNSSTPISANKTFRTVYDNQRSMTLRILEGERADARKNYCLETCTIDNLTPAPSGQCSVTWTMSIDVNGILTVTAHENNKNNVKNLKLSYLDGHIHGDQITNAIPDAAENTLEDLHFHRFVEAKIRLYRYCEKMIYNFDILQLEQRYKEIYKLCKESKALVSQMDMENETQLDSLTTIVTDTCAPVANRHNFLLT